MESYRIKDLTFFYPGQEIPALCHVSLTVKRGEFMVLCGQSGCGKSTLLRQLKTMLAPHGSRTGEVVFCDQPLDSVDMRNQTERIGFVLQSPDNQIVTDKVWHELAFGLESLGYATADIRARVAEMASFFGIENWFYQKVDALSGGQKQLLNLAAVMAMQPEVLILDEPTSQLDPIAAQDFLWTLAKINREIGTTVILSEHRLEEAVPLADRVVVMDGGKVIANGSPREVEKTLREQGHTMYRALPTPMRIYADVPNSLSCPLTVREGRTWLETLATEREIDPSRIPKAVQNPPPEQPLIHMRDVWFRYEKDGADVVKGLSLKIAKGEFYALVGGNGTGKTTTLSLISGLRTPYRGKVLVQDKPVEEIGDRYTGLLGVLPQNPQSLFVKKTVELDLYEMLKESKLSAIEKEERVKKIARLCGIEALLSQHPYDLSGGEQQKAALAKILLNDPEILLLDEPTKGLDACFKEKLAALLAGLKRRGVTVIMVSHDIEFCARYADRCGLFFDGNVVSSGTPREFFVGKRFYTTAANRMVRTVLPQAVLPEDVITACGGEARPPETEEIDDTLYLPEEQRKKAEAPQKPVREKLTWKRVAFGVFFGAAFLATLILFYNRYTDWRDYLVQAASVFELALCLAALIPQKRLDLPASSRQMPGGKRRLSRRLWAAAGLILIAVPLTIFVGMYYLGDRKYYFISLLIILETMLPFAMVFEQRRPKARELVVISVLCAIAVAGRTAFFMLPQFKPVVALVILAGVCFGGETGFLVGAVTGFVSGFFFGQGPWTPWQMFAFGIIGFLAGVLFQKGLLQKTKGSLAVFGAIAAFVVYGGIMNTATVLLGQARPTKEAFLSAYLMGIPFDLIHAVSTVFFLWFLSAPMIEKLDRIKTKYGLMEE